MLILPFDSVVTAGKPNTIILTVVSAITLPQVSKSITFILGAVAVVSVSIGNLLPWYSTSDTPSILPYDLVIGIANSLLVSWTTATSSIISDIWSSVKSVSKLVNPGLADVFVTTILVLIYLAILYIRFI